MYYVILNPSAHSGKGASKWQQLKTFLDNNKITYILHTTTSAKDTTDYVRSITTKHYATLEPSFLDLVVLGGDGTLNCVVNGIVDMVHTRITYLPTGTSNDFARSLGYSSDPKQQFLALHKEKQTYACNVGNVTLGNKNRRFNVSCEVV